MMFLLETKGLAPFLLETKGLAPFLKLQPTRFATKVAFRA